MNATEPLQLRLYVLDEGEAGRVAPGLRRLLEDALGERFYLEVLTLDAAGEQVESDRIFAVPTLVRRAPPPVRHLIGDLGDPDEVLAALGVTAPWPRES